VQRRSLGSRREGSSLVQLWHRPLVLGSWQRKGDGLFAGATHQAARVILSMKGEGVLSPAGITPSRNLPNPTKRFTVTVL
jgi:hypothetical protein